VTGIRDRYRDKAMECTSAADHSHDPAQRLNLLNIAQLFMKLAEHVTSRLDHGITPTRPDEERENRKHRASD
jgi:hypothetical protein